MDEKYNVVLAFFETWLNSFEGLTGIQQKNFLIKKEHSLRVAEIARDLGTTLELTSEDAEVLCVTGLLHDIGRFRQLAEYGTFNDEESVDHANYSVQIINEEHILDSFDESVKELIIQAIRLHNKFEIPRKLKGLDLLYVNILRDADKLDIFRVLTDYYTDRNREPNHTLTWELPRGVQVSPAVAQDLLSGKLVLKSKVRSEIDVKILQMSWVYDLNYKPSFEVIFKNRYLEKIYSTLPKNDLIIEIYTKVKVFAENKLLH